MPLERYTVTATNAWGSVSAFVTITVSTVSLRALCCMLRCFVCGSCPQPEPAMLPIASILWSDSVRSRLSLTSAHVGAELACRLWLVVICSRRRWSSGRPPPSTSCRTSRSLWCRPRSRPTAVSAPSRECCLNVQAAQAALLRGMMRDPQRHFRAARAAALPVPLLS